MECIVCFEPITKPKLLTLRCSHYFHEACLLQWNKDSGRCPMCRTPINLRCRAYLSRKRRNCSNKYESGSNGYCSMHAEKFIEQTGSGKESSLALKNLDTTRSENDGL